MRSSEIYDALIIGSGAGGGPLALELAGAGWRVLMLEKGPTYQRETFPADEIDNLWHGGFVPPVAEEPHMLVHAGLVEPRPTELGWTANCVGGGTVHMGAYLSRFHPDDFQMRSRFGEHEAAADWPYSYDELEPYYSKAEWEVGVSGAAGVNPFEGPRSLPYPMPPLDDHPLAEHLDGACRRLGLNPYPTPRGINSRPYKGRPQCEYCTFCAGYGCRVGARGSAQEALLTRAVATGHCELRDRTMVRQIDVGPDGRATGCSYIDDRTGREVTVRARTVCVCCSAVESARLLLMSTSSRFPQGLANSNGQVGRNLQFHCVSLGHGKFRRGRHSMPFVAANPFLNRSVMDYYFLPADVSDPPKGGTIIYQNFGRGPVLTAKILAQLGDGPMAWGTELKARLRDFYEENRVVSFEAQHDFLPNDGTFVSLDPEVRDRWGLPVARITLDEPEHHPIAGRFLVEKGLATLDALGADELVSVAEGHPAGYLVHGTCRAGTDSDTSTLNGDCRAHDVPNLFVVDGSFMPTSGGAPPTLTILANSFRTADRMIAAGKRGELGH